MKKIYLALFSLFLVFGLSANSHATDYDIDGNAFTLDVEALTVPGAYTFSGSTEFDLNPLGGSVLDYFYFTVASTAGYISLSGSAGAEGFGFSSFSTALEMKTDGWAVVAPGLDTPLGPTTWSSLVSFSPLSPNPTEYRLVVSGTQLAGPASYAGSIFISPVTPVPEPEIYAMMAAGLGLMGFVARRRQRNAA